MNLFSQSENKVLPFREACEFGKLHVAQWLIENFTDIDYHADNEWAFRHACRNGPEGTSELARAKNI